MQEITCNNPEIIEVLIGRYDKDFDEDFTQTVRFKGEGLAYREWSRSRGRSIENLYVSVDNRLLLHTESYSGGTVTYKLEEVSKTNIGWDFYNMGVEACRRSRLGVDACRRSSLLTLDEALEMTRVK